MQVYIYYLCESEVAESCPTLCDSVDCSPPGSSVHGIHQARILEWVAIFFSRGIFLTQGSNPGLPALQADALTSELPGKPIIYVSKCIYIHVCVYAAAAVKSLQSCPTLCNPIDGSPPGSPVPGILQARTLEWVAISFSNA